MEPDSDARIYEYTAARLAEIHEAIEELDRSSDPLAHSEARRILVSEAARLVAALATFDQGRWPSLN